MSGISRRAYIRAAGYVELTLTLLSLERLEPALAQYHLAQAQRPRDTRIHEMIGVALMEHKHYEQICTAFEKAGELGTNSSKMQEIWGAALFRLGNIEGAIEHHGQAAKLTPDDADTHSRLGYALETAGRTDEAIASYQRAVDLDPEHAAASRLAKLKSQQP